MIRLAPTVLLFFVVTFSGISGEATNRLQFPRTGFSIAPLEGTLEPAPLHSLIMYLPARKDFAPNVNVQVLPYNGSVEDYAALSLKQFQNLGLKVIQQTTSKGTAVVFEYAGTMQERSLHWYAKAEKANGRIYLATATSTEDQWPEVAPQLKLCVDSFRSDVSAPSQTGKPVSPR